MLAEYQRHTQERGGIPPLPLNVEQTSQLCELLKNPIVTGKQIGRAHV